MNTAFWLISGLVGLFVCSDLPVCKFLGALLVVVALGTVICWWLERR